MVFYYLRNTVKYGPKTPENIQSRKRFNTFFSLVTTRVISSVIHAKYQENVLSFSRYCIAATPSPLCEGLPPLWRGRGAGFLNSPKSRGNWNFSKLRGEKKRGKIPKSYTQTDIVFWEIYTFCFQKYILLILVDTLCSPCQY